MDRHSTLDELAAFARNEQNAIKALGLKKEAPEKTPSQQSIDAILAFSKSYSNRASKILGRIEITLN